MKRLLIPVALLIGSAAFGQKALTHYFPAGQANSGVLVKSYVSPLGEDLGTLLNSGWYTTGATHSRLGFDIGLTMNTVFIGSGRKEFSDPQLSGLQFNGTTMGGDKVPSVYGQKKNYPLFSNTGGPNQGVPFRGPDGIDPHDTYGVNGQVLPTLQAGVGLFANTDIRLRYTPQTTINGIKSGSMGAGIQHDIKQHFSGLKLLPFSLSLFVGYTKLDGSVDLSGLYASSGTTQKGAISGSAYTAQAIISKSLGVITFFGSIGYSSSSTKFDVKGTYVVDQTSDGLPLIAPYTMTDPYSYTFKTSGMRLTGGTRLKLGPFFLNGDYTFFNSQQLLTVGTGFTFR